jgi:hypothetical protein
MIKDKPYDFPPILWNKNIHRTLDTMWENLTLLHHDFYQKSFVFDRCVEEQKDIIREFFADKHVYSYVKDVVDPVKGPVSWLVLIAMSERFSKYK